MDVIISSLREGPLIPVQAVISTHTATRIVSGHSFPVSHRAYYSLAIIGAGFAFLVCALQRPEYSF